MKKFQFHLLSLLILSFSSCTKDWDGVPGRGAIHTENRQIENFDGIDFQLGGNLRIIPDSNFAVYVSTYDNYQSLIRTHVEGGHLVIDSYKSLHDDDDVNIDVHLPYLDYINLGGSGCIRTTGYFNSGTIKVQISGSGNIDYAGDSNSLFAVVTGSGKIQLAGNSNNVTMTMSGSGNIKGFPLHCVKNHVTISGSGTVETYVQDDLKVNISGSGKVYYMGNPIINQNISGSGKVIHSW